MKHFLNLNELTSNESVQIIDQAIRIKKERDNNQRAH